MAKAPLLAEDVYAEFYEIDEPVIKFQGRINKIQHVQQNLGKIVEEQAKDEVLIDQHFNIYGLPDQLGRKGTAAQKVGDQRKGERNFSSLFHI